MTLDHAELRKVAKQVKRLGFRGTGLLGHWIDAASPDTVLALLKEIEGGWELIEMAPRDGTDVLLAAPEKTPWVDAWMDIKGEFGWVYCDLWAEPVTPTHWRPLPAPPQAAKSST